MQHARTARTGAHAALRKALAWLLTLALAFSLCGLPAAYGAEADGGAEPAVESSPGTRPLEAPVTPQDTDAADFDFEPHCHSEPHRLPSPTVIPSLSRNLRPRQRSTAGRRLLRPAVGRFGSRGPVGPSLLKTRCVFRALGPKDSSAGLGMTVGCDV
jgi:hypothetical protein